MAKVLRWNRQFSILDTVTNQIAIQSPFKKIDTEHTTNLDEYFSIASGSYKEYSMIDKNMCYFEPEASTKVTLSGGSGSGVGSGSVVYYADSISAVGSELDTIRFEPSGSSAINIRVIILNE